MHPSCSLLWPAAAAAAGRPRGGGAAEWLELVAKQPQRCCPLFSGGAVQSLGGGSGGGRARGGAGVVDAVLWAGRLQLGLAVDPIVAHPVQTADIIRKGKPKVLVEAPERRVEARMEA